MDGKRIEVGSLYGAHTQQGIVELVVGDERVQMDIPKAREVLGMLAGALEAAITDELIMRFLVGKIGLTAAAAAAALLDFREMRQGSRDVVYPH